MSSNRINLPYYRGAADQRQFVDEYGVVREYDSESDALIIKGVISTYPLVDQTRDGLISPRLFNRIRSVEQYEDELKQTIKIDGHPLAYFYLLNSSDDLIRFYPESRTQVRVEVDRNRLYQKILRNFCPGDQGNEGPEGLQGRNGRPAAAERSQRFQIVSPTEATGETTVAVPLPDAQLSVRLLDGDGVAFAEILIDVTGSAQGQATLNQISEDIVVDPVKTTIEATFGGTELEAQVQLHVFLSAGEFTSSFRWKARQRGPQGELGTDGLNFLEVKSRFIDDSALVAEQAVVNLRKSGSSNDILHHSLPLPDVNCVLQLKFVSGLPNDGIKTQWAAVLPTTLDCKDICYCLPELPLVEAPLNLLEWTPMKQCADRLRYDMTKFDWMSQTSKDACGILPFKIAVDPRPPEQCCVAAGTFIHCFGGLRLIEDLQVGDRVLCPDGSYRPIEKFFDNGTKSCVEVTFSDGSQICATPDHKIPVGGVLKEISELTGIDQISKAPGSLQHLKESHYGTDEDFEDGYMIGYLLGDGWVSNRNIGIVQHDVDRKSFMMCHGFLSKRFGKVAVRTRRVINGNVLYSTWESKKAKDYFINKGWYKNLKERITSIPKTFYTESYRFYQGFYSAMITTDGCITKHGDVNVDHSVMRDTPLACKLILDYLGFQSTLKEQKQSKTSRFKGNGRCFRTDVLRLSTHSQEFADLISATEERKLNNLKITSNHSQPIQQIPAISIDITKQKIGMLVGIFTFFGGYNSQTKRAWINKSVPSHLKQLLLQKGLTQRYFTRNTSSKIRDLLNVTIDPSFAAGFLQVMIDYKRSLKRGMYLITRNSNEEILRITQSLNAIGCRYEISEMRIMKSKNLSKQILIRRSADVYKLFTITKRQTIGRTRMISPQRAVTIRSVKPIGPKHVYDYAVSPHFLMMANGLILNDCAQDLFTCFNQGDACPVEGTATAPERFEKKDCWCDCAPATELVKVAVEPVEKSYGCSLNGKINEWPQELEFNGPTKITVTVRLNDSCVELSGKTEECSFSTNIIPCCLSEELTMDETIKTIAGEGSVSLLVEGKGSARLDVLVNLEKTNCCVGYDLIFNLEPII
ncbi:MAG: hypothetical protein Q8K86_07350 [Candidatus Nanopelagicaceae bacterium]|nr:hypothetical protein [Candidatus Nanopelagicaceae bacterium]